MLCVFCRKGYPLTEPFQTTVPLTADEWIQLSPGDIVIVQREGESPNAGQIDAITEDGKIF